MFIQTEETPNPATLKFLPGQDVLPQGTLAVTRAEDAGGAPLAEALFAIAGVKSVFFGHDFITVTKAADKDWAVLKPALLSAIMDHFVSGRPVVLTPPVAESAPADDSDIARQIRTLLDEKVRPAVAKDGGDITFDRFEDGVVYLHLRGACAGCPSATMTLKAGVENMLKHYSPDVKDVRQARL